MTIEEWLNKDELAITIWNNKYRFENEEINPIPTPEEPEENEENNTQEENVSNWANENKILVYVGAFSILVILILIVGIIKFKKLWLFIVKMQLFIV